MRRLPRNTVLNEALPRYPSARSEGDKDHRARALHQPFPQALYPSYALFERCVSPRAFTDSIRRCRRGG